MSEEWKPAENYFVEPKYYKSPKLKEVNVPDDATNVPNAAHLRFNHYYSDDEVLDIWAKPLDSKDYVATPAEIKALRTNPSADKFRSYALFSPNSPCLAHVKNMKLDGCDAPDIGQTNKTMLQRSYCNRHFYNFTTCLNKHRKWYEARYLSLAEAVPEIAPKYQKDVKYSQDPSLYEEFAPKHVDVDADDE